jgi:hypothetical protein
MIAQGGCFVRDLKRSNKNFKTRLYTSNNMIAFRRNNGFYIRKLSPRFPLRIIFLRIGMDRKVSFAILTTVSL